MGNEKQYIENIRERQLNSDKEFMLDSLSGAIDRLQKAFPRYGSFLMEFVQNADDAKARTISITLFGNGIRIENDGLEFSEDDVKSICKVGRSSKTPRDYIGYLGVGFKAVFLITESPRIYSGEFSFKFDKSSWEEAENIPWQVIPIWIGDLDENMPSREFTVFELPLKSPSLVEKLRLEVTPEHLNNRILLFLRNLTKIEVRDVEGHLNRRISKSKLPNTKGHEVYRIQEHRNGDPISDDLWLVLRSTPDVPVDVRNDYVTREWEREIVEKREVMVAFRLNDEFDLRKEEKGTAHIGVFSFLPLKEIPSGLNFLIQGDFLTTPGRGEFARDCLWNDWLANEVYKLVIEKCIPAFMKDEKWRMRATDVLYTAEGGHDLFERFIKRPLNEYLESHPLLIAQDGQPARKEDLVVVEPELWQFLTNDDLSTVYPQKKVMHAECKPHSKLKPETAPSEVHEFLRSSVSDSLLQKKAKAKDILWFKVLYATLVDKYERWGYFSKKYYQYNVEYDNFWNEMRNFPKPIILTEECTLSRIDSSYTNPKKLRIPKEVKDQFSIVHPELAEDEAFAKLQKRLNEERYYNRLPVTKVLLEITEADIKIALNRKAALELHPEEWDSLHENERIEKIVHLKDIWAAKAVSLKDYAFLTLPDKRGQWKKPEELIFPEEYEPEHNIEAIQAKGLLDIQLDYLATTFVEGQDERRTREWRQFFTELGVNNKLSQKEFAKIIVQRIGILVTLKYEQRKGRRARELARSEETGGFDIIAESDEEGSGLIQSEDRYIEVKSRKQPNPDIFLTPRQLATLSEKRDKYYVYVVKDALKYPTLCVSRGDRILEITDKKIIIPYSKWSTEAKDDEYQP